MATKQAFTPTVIALTTTSKPIITTTLAPGTITEAYINDQLTKTKVFTIPNGNYTFSGKITVPVGAKLSFSPGVVIKSTTTGLFISIDDNGQVIGNGASINGPGLNTRPVGGGELPNACLEIKNSGYIKDLIIDGFYTGIHLGIPPNNPLFYKLPVVSGCTTKNCFRGIWAQGIDRGIIMKCVCDNNGSWGIDLDSLCNNVICVDCICRNNVQDGIFIEESSSNSWIINCITNGNQLRGVNLNILGTTPPTQNNTIVGHTSTNERSYRILASPEKATLNTMIVASKGDEFNIQSKSCIGNVIVDSAITTFNNQSGNPTIYTIINGISVTTPVISPVTVAGINQQLATSKVCIVPNGTYTFNDIITIPEGAKLILGAGVKITFGTMSIPPNQVIDCTIKMNNNSQLLGNGAIIYGTSNIYAPCIYAPNSNVLIKDLNIDSFNTTAILLNGQNYDNIAVIRACNIRNCGQGIICSSVKRCVIMDTICDKNNDGINLSYSQNVLCWRCSFTNNLNTGINVSTGCLNSVFVDCYTAGNKVNGFLIESSFDSETQNVNIIRHVSDEASPINSYFINEQAGTGVKGLYVNAMMVASKGAIYNNNSARCIGNINVDCTIATTKLAAQSSLTVIQ